MSADVEGPRVLVTGFEPFDGDDINPSQELARELDGARLGPASLRSATLSVDRLDAPRRLEALIGGHAPSLVVCLGQGTGRRAIDLETTAHNAIDFGDRRDNGGNEAHGEALIVDGPAVLGTTLPLPGLARRLAAAGHPVGLSHDAGRHLCNAVYYRLLARPRGPFAVFVHVPLLPEQAARRGRGEPALPLAVTRPCLREVLAGLCAPLPVTPS